MVENKVSTARKLKGEQENSDDEFVEENERKEQGKGRENNKNITFWVKYRDDRYSQHYQAVPVKTHYDLSLRERDAPLITVGDLIADMKLTLPSRLGSINTSQLTLHSTENGLFNETPLNVSLTLNSLQPLGTDGKSPLIIKKSKSMSEYMSVGFRTCTVLF